jgi:hypothetical protein
MEEGRGRQFGPELLDLFFTEKSAVEGVGNLEDPA